MHLKQFTLCVTVLIQISLIPVSEGSAKGECQTKTNWKNDDLVTPCVFPFKYKNITVKSPYCVWDNSLIHAEYICPIVDPEKNKNWYEDRNYGICELTPVGTCLQKKVIESIECCKQKGVPDECSYACDSKSSTESRNIANCANYGDFIEECVNGPILKDLKGCCDHHNVNNEAPNCYGTLCNGHCEDKPWKWFEKYPKEECEKYIKSIRYCCNEN